VIERSPDLVGLAPAIEELSRPDYAARAVCQISPRGRRAYRLRTRELTGWPGGFDCLLVRPNRYEFSVQQQVVGDLNAPAMKNGIKSEMTWQTVVPTSSGAIEAPIVRAMLVTSCGRSFFWRNHGHQV
jgi:hypothetical protein